MAAWMRGRCMRRLCVSGLHRMWRAWLSLPWRAALVAAQAAVAQAAAVHQRSSLQATVQCPQIRAVNLPARVQTHQVSGALVQAASGALGHQVSRALRAQARVQSPANQTLLKPQGLAVMCTGVSGSMARVEVCTTEGERRGARRMEVCWAQIVVLLLACGEAGRELCLGATGETGNIALACGRMYELPSMR